LSVIVNARAHAILLHVPAVVNEATIHQITTDCISTIQVNIHFILFSKNSFFFLSAQPSSFSQSSFSTIALTFFSEKFSISPVHKNGHATLFPFFIISYIFTFSLIHGSQSSISIGFFSFIIHN
jgi:hypothetical protein